MTSSVYLKEDENVLAALSCASALTEDNCKTPPKSLTSWLTHKCTNFISRSPVGTRTVISKYMSIDTHIYSENLTHIMSLTTAVLPPRLQGVELMKGRPTNYNCSTWSSQ